MLGASMRLARSAGTAVVPRSDRGELKRYRAAGRSPVLFSVTLALVLSLLLPHTSATRGVQAASSSQWIPVMTLADFCGAPGWTLNGDALREGRDLALTTGHVGLHGSSFFARPLPVAGGFRTDFAFQITHGSPGEHHGDGFAFVVQPHDSDALGQGASGIGYEGLRDAFVVEFDTYMNDAWGDPNNHHVSVHIPPFRDGFVSPAEVPGRWVELNSSLADGLEHQVTIRYDAGESLDSPGRLTIVVDRVSRSMPLQLDRVLSLRNDSGALVGFTAATGGQYEKHMIRRFSLEAWLPADTPPGSACARGYAGPQCGPGLDHQSAWAECASLVSCAMCVNDAAGACCGWCHGRGRCMTIAAVLESCPGTSESFDENEPLSPFACERPWLPSTLVAPALLLLGLLVVGAVVAIHRLRGVPIPTRWYTRAQYRPPPAGVGSEQEGEPGSVEMRSGWYEERPEGHGERGLGEEALDEERSALVRKSRD